MTGNDITIASMSVPVITYDVTMGRWAPDATARLAAAALELYVQRGFDDTTVAEIAQRAGLSERTFFRHFADKRDVLFSGSGQLQQLMVDAAASAPSGATPMAAITASLEAAAGVFEERREFARARQSVIVDNAELRERELIKLANLTEALAGTLRARNVKEPLASMTAEAGVASFRVAFERWCAQRGRRPLIGFIREATNSLREAVSDT